MRGNFRIQTVNDPPVARDDTASTPYGESVTVDLLLNDTDVDGDRLTLSMDHGTITRATGLGRLFATAGDEGVVTYKPAPGWSGADTVTYLVDDGHHQDEATLTVITEDAPPPPNRAPITVDDRADTTTGQPVTADVLVNDMDPDGDKLTLTKVTNGENGTADVVNDRVVYTPKGTRAGVDTVTYTVSDGELTATGTLQVTTKAAPPTNDAPTAVNDDAGIVRASKGGSVEYDVVANDKDPDGDELRVDRVIGTHHGTVEIEETKGRTLVFTYADDFAGTEEISYVLTDGQYESTATLTVTVTNDAPEAQDDTREKPVMVGENATIDVLGNDSDDNGDTLTLVDDGFSDPARGSVKVVEGQVVYTPDHDAAAGPDSFTYTVRDTRGGRATGQVRVTVARPVRDVAVSVIEGERDADHVQLTARITGYPQQGHVRLDITGQAVNAVVDGSLPASCSKDGNAWVCDLDDLAGERHDISLQLTIRGQVRTTTFQVTPLNFTEPADSAGNNAAEWPSGS